MFEERIERLFKATGAQTDSELARKLEIQPPSVAGARKRQLLPGSWVEKIALDYNISADWILFGCGSMHRGEAAPLTAAPSSAPSPPPTPTATAKTSPTCPPCPPCPHCAELKRELDMERRERRALMEGMWQVTTENRVLWRENGELREKCARLEERQYQRNNHDGGEATGNAG